MDIFDDVDDKLFIFNSLFTDTLNRHAPAKTIRVKKNRALWISKSIRDEMDQQNKLQRRFLSTRSALAWNEYKQQRNLVVSLQRKAKIEYFQKLLSKGTSPTILWNMLRNALPPSPSSSICSSGGANLTPLANSLNDHFVSISSSSQSLPSPPTCSHSPSSTLSLAPVSPEWSEKALASMKCTPAMGVDNIPSYPLNVSRTIISVPLSSTLSSSISISPFLSCGSVVPSGPYTKVVIMTVLTTIAHSHSYQHVVKSWRNMSKSSFPVI